MKKIGIVLTMLFVGLAMYAQEPQVLVLKDGTVVKGNVEKLPDGGARVTNEFGDIFEYSADEVSYAGKELSERQMKKQQKAASARDYAAPMKGYKLFLEPGIGYGVISLYVYSLCAFSHLYFNEIQKESGMANPVTLCQVALFACKRRCAVRVFYCKRRANTGAWTLLV